MSTLQATGLLLLLPLPSLAGHYVVSYVGGKTTITGTDLQCSISPDYETVNGIRVGGGTAGVCVDPPPSLPRTGTVNCAGPITAHFHGTQDNPADTEDPPPAVAVKETSSASWTADGGVCDDGLGDTAVPSMPTYTQVSTGTPRWQVVENPGIDFDIPSCEPLASCSHAVGGPSGLPGGHAEVSYQAVALPIRMTFTGDIITHAGKQKIQLGDPLTATVVLPSELLGPSFTWTISAGRPFATYQASSSSAQKTAWQSTNTAATTCRFAYGTMAGLACPVNCAVTTTSPALSFNVKRDIYTVSPAFSVEERNIGDMALLPNATSPQAFQLAGVMFVDPLTNLQVSTGVYIKATVISPAEFGSPAGGWNYVQLVKPKWHVFDTSNNEWHSNHYGQWGLDTVFPYLQEPPLTTYPAVTGVKRYFLDSPGYGDVSGANTAYFEGVFQTYILYTTSNSGANYVPLKVDPWYCTGTASRQTPTWSVSGETSVFLPFVNLAFPLHPEWTFKHDANDPLLPGPP